MLNWMATAIKRKKSLKNNKKIFEIFVISLGSFAISLTRINLNILAVTFEYSILCNIGLLKIFKLRGYKWFRILIFKKCTCLFITTIPKNCPFLKIFKVHMIDYFDLILYVPLKIKLQKLICEKKPKKFETKSLLQLYLLYIIYLWFVKQTIIKSQINVLNIRDFFYTYLFKCC